MNTKGKKNTFGGAEKRKNPRTDVQEFFALSVVIPNKLGMARIYMRDLSVGGLCIHTEMLENFAIGQTFDLQLYTNPVFFLKLPSKVVRVKSGEVGVEFTEPKGKAAHAVAKLLEFFEAALESKEE